MNNLSVDPSDPEKEREKINEQIEEKLGAVDLLVEPEEQVGKL